MERKDKERTKKDSGVERKNSTMKKSGKKEKQEAKLS
jgi:hypothetical protein